MANLATYLAALPNPAARAYAHRWLRFLAGGQRGTPPDAEGIPWPAQRAVRMNVEGYSTKGPRERVELPETRKGTEHG